MNNIICVLTFYFVYVALVLKMVNVFVVLSLASQRSTV